MAMWAYIWTHIKNVWAQGWKVSFSIGILLLFCCAWTVYLTSKFYMYKPNQNPGLASIFHTEGDGNFGYVGHFESIGGPCPNLSSGTGDNNVIIGEKIKCDQRGDNSVKP